jgi:hypothetical protein
MSYRPPNLDEVPDLLCAYGSAAPAVATLPIRTTGVGRVML